VDATLPDGLSVEMTRGLQQGWAAPGTGNTALLTFDNRLFRLYFQHRPEYARPAAALDPQVRHAFYLTVDKDGVNQVELAGLGELADSWISPDDPRRPQFADVIPPRSHDPAAAQRLLADDGWRRGADGILVSGRTGERMETEIRVVASQGHDKTLAVLADGWAQVGADVIQTVIPQSLNANQEYKDTQPFMGVNGARLGLNWEAYQYGCARVATAANHWSGTIAGYCNPTADPLIQRLQVTIPQDERTRLQVEIMRLILKEDYVELPMWWTVTPIIWAAGVTGLGKLDAGPFGNTQPPWNVNMWDKQ
jgi:ABC-type transport system substrate-binding protein